MKSTISKLGTTIILAALASAAAFAQNVSVNAQAPAELNTYHTYSFKNLYTTDSMIEPRVAIAIDRNLQTRGWHEVQQGGDVLITAVLADNSDRGLYRSFYSELDGLKWNAVGVNAPGEAPTSAKRAPVGTLIVDMYDSHTGALLWRGTAADFLTTDTASNELKVDDAVTHMLSGLPFEDAPGVYNIWNKGN